MPIDMKWDSGQLRNCEHTVAQFHSEGVGHRMRGQFSHAAEASIEDFAEQNPGRYQTMVEPWHHNAKPTISGQTLPPRRFSLASSVEGKPYRIKSSDEFRLTKPRIKIRAPSNIRLARSNLNAKLSIDLQSSSVMEQLQEQKSASKRRGRGHLISLSEPNASKPKQRQGKFANPLDKVWSGDWATIASSSSCWGETVNDCSLHRSVTSLLEHHNKNSSSSGVQLPDSIQVLSPALQLPENSSERAHVINQALASTQAQQGISSMVTKPYTPRAIAQTTKETNPFAAHQRSRQPERALLQRLRHNATERLGERIERCTNSHNALENGQRIRTPRITATSSTEVMPEKVISDNKNGEANELRMTHKLAPTHTFTRIFQPERIKITDHKSGRNNSFKHSNALSTSRKDSPLTMSSISNEVNASNAIQAIANVVDGSHRETQKIHAPVLNFSLYPNFSNILYLPPRGTIEDGGISRAIRRAH